LSRNLYKKPFITKKPNNIIGIPVSQPAKKRRSYRTYLIATLLISIVSVGICAGYALQTVSIALEVKEPIEIVDYPSSFSLFPGETVEFNITVQNNAPITYSRFLEFHLNDTDYQAKYVTFSNENYTIAPGTQTLSAWLKVSPNAPPANLLISININANPQTSPTPSPKSSSELPPVLELLGGGARWAARNGTCALYINWKDNWANHHLTDGADWGWFPESSMDTWNSIAPALEQYGFDVDLVGDIPSDLSGYDLVVIFAYYAVEPRHEPLIREYILNGGSVVILAGAPCYFTVYCKNLSPYSSYSFGYAEKLPEWLGCKQYTNAYGTARTTANNPFGTSILTSDAIFTSVPELFGYAGVTALDSDTQVIAEWSTGPMFAFTYEYGKGRVYYQAVVDFT
jgi:hypothetical protein